MANKQPKHKQVEDSLHKSKKQNLYCVVDQNTKELNDDLKKKLYKNANTIYWTNVAVFVVLCISVALFCLAPLIFWLVGLHDDNERLKNAYKTLVAYGVPCVCVTALYGGLVFWLLLPRIRIFEQNGHKVFIYMGVTTTILSIDNKIVTYVKCGYLMDPTATAYIRLPKGEICKYEQTKKFGFHIDFNWHNVNKHEKYSVKFTDIK